MPLTLAQMEALIADGGANTAAEMRQVIKALYDWIPPIEKYKRGRLAGETAHASDDFFTAYSGYTEQVVTGTATWGLSNIGLGVKFNGQSSNDISCTLKAVPGGPPLTIETCWSALIQTASNPVLGLVLTNGTATTSTAAGIGDFSNFGTAVIGGTLTNMATSAISPNIERGRIHQGMIFVRLIQRSTNAFRFAVSLDGTNWTNFGGADFNFGGFTPTHMGFFVSAWSATSVYTAAFPYLRVYEADLSV